MIERADYAVIGGGPAGASAARRLAAAGASVLLFERRPMPRPKPCGGALSARGLAHLDFRLPDSLIDGEVFGVRAHVGERSVEARLDRRIAVLVTRARFDQFLVSKAEEAGARVLWQRVTAVETHPGEIVLATPEGRFAVTCAVACEGANARFGAAVAAPVDRLFCMAADVPVARPDAQAEQGGLLDIYHGAAEWGWGWVFHHGPYASVGLAGAASAVRRPRETLRRFACRCGLSLDGVSVRGHFIPCGGVRGTRCADRLLVAGDAAGLADPFTGGGMARAIRSGQLAAEAVLGADARRGFSAASLAVYDRRCRQAFGSALRGARLLVRVVRRWPSVLVRAGTSDLDVLRRYLRIQTGEGTYRAFLGWFVPRALGRWVRGKTKRLC